MDGNRIAVSVGGTWHAPHLCYQLEKRGLLAVVFTTTPRARFAQRASVERRRIKWLPYPAIVGGLYARYLGVPEGLYPWRPYEFAATFDRAVAKRLCRFAVDLLVAFAQFGLNSMTYAKRAGAKAILERGSTHTTVRRAILAEEHERLGLQPPACDSRVIDRELAEYELADYIMVPSRLAKDSFVMMGCASEKILQVPYGVDIDLFRPKGAVVRARAREKFAVLSVGNLGVEKGTAYLLDAVRRALGESAQIWFVGTVDGYLASQIERLPNVTFFGHLHPLELAEIYRKASVYCLLSLQEGMSLTVLEAMASGLPVIASTSTGAAEVITDGVDGFLVDTRDAERAAERLRQLYEDPELCQTIGAAARRRAEQLSWDSYGESVVSTYRTTQTISG